MIGKRNRHPLSASIAAGALILGVAAGPAIAADGIETRTPEPPRAGVAPEPAPLDHERADHQFREGVRLGIGAPRETPPVAATPPAGVHDTAQEARESAARAENYADQAVRSAEQAEQAADRAQAAANQASDHARTAAARADRMQAQRR